MSHFRRILGAAAALIGASGAIFSGVAAVEAWRLADRLEREVPEAVGDMERVVSSVQDQADATLALIDAARDRVRFVSETVEELASAADRRPEETSLLETLDPDIARRLEAAEAFILALQESLRGLHRALVMLDALPILPRRIAPAVGTPGDRPLITVAASLAEAADLLDEATRTLDRLRSGQALSPRQLDQFRDLLGEVDRTLGDTRNQIGSFFDRLDQAGSRLADLRSAAPRWIRRGATAATFLLICFGASQLNLLAHGWALMTRPALRAAGTRTPAPVSSIDAGPAPRPPGGPTTTPPASDEDDR
ncbi:hypothetical protein [Tautonia sociabilis]|uniref:Uncharacterized protein n=1 Tax=Tautonia sociabilis TaxID=2080755 RepID=A0A432MML9_9BACT|nr:hypothetical protein [Tautonia sociabilis]RUL88694.1 hypothetical protein TsocGM_06035 [Tautonia sociabilis]